MALMITGKMIRSDGTRHTAELVRAGAGGAWRVSWLPGRVLTRSQATTAMMIARALGRIPAAAGPLAYGGRLRGRVDSWAAELGLAGPTAVAWASEPLRAGPPAGRDTPSCPACQAGAPHIGWTTPGPGPGGAAGQ